MAGVKEKIKNTDAVVAKVVRTVLSNARHATAKTKKRGEVSGGGKKPWKQKGTGRARAGSSRSPLWRGGGVVFGPSGNQNFDIKASKKEKQIATKAAFATKKAITKELSMPKLAKTKEAAKFMASNDLTGRTLILIDFTPEKGKKQTNDVAELKRVFKNIPDVTVCYKAEVNAYDILNAQAIAILVAKKAAPKAAAKETKVNETPRQARGTSKTEGKEA